MSFILRASLRGALSFIIVIAGVNLVGTVARGQNPAPASAKKQLTLDRLFSAPYLGGSGVDGIEWRPDGKVFSYFERNAADGTGLELWTMDRETGARKVLVSADTLKSAMQPQTSGGIALTSCMIIAALRIEDVTSQRTSMTTSN